MRRWSLALCVAVTLHLILAAGAYLRLDRPAPPAEPIQAIMVELAATATAPARPADERPPGPEAKDRPASAETPAVRETQRPPNIRGVLPAHSERVASPSNDVAAKASTRREASAPPSIAAPPAPVLAATRTSAASDQSVAVTWRGLLLGRLKAYRRYPRRAQSVGQEGVVFVVFTVDRRGSVLSVRVARSAGYPLLDDEALATVRRASPMPPPPDEVPGDPVEVVVPVDFHVR
ncbi:TonB family protein [Caulobacter sp. AP07]|nr:TonB family protein [Caulobacter sp. AP07]